MMKNTATRSTHFTASKSTFAKRNPKLASAPYTSLFSRLYFALIAGLIGAGLGILFDLFLSFARAVFQPQASGEFIWFLSYILAATAALIGFAFARKSGEFFAQLFSLTDETESSSGSELIRIIAKALLIAMLGWSVFVLFL